MTGSDGAETRAWRFSTCDLPAEERGPAWVEAMRRLRLPPVQAIGNGATDGTVTVASSPLGLQFALLEAGPQEIAGQSDTQDEGLWISLLLQGRGVIRAPGFEAPFGPGFILCGVTRTASTLRMEERHSQLLVLLPRVAIAPRLLAGLPRSLLLLDARAGMPAIFHAMLVETAMQLDRLSTDDMRPVEIALIEFLVANLAASGGREARGGAEGARTALLYRILQRMETLLGDPDLSLAHLAGDAGISPRYLRRLLAAEQLNFSTVLRTRRLERCRADLTSPLHAQLGISEIAFRWGFNDAAHFSRSFRDQFGMSPREYRQSGGRDARQGHAAD